VEKTLCFILGNENGKEVFVNLSEKGWEPPTYFQEVPDNIEFDDPNPYNQWFEQQYGVEVYQRYVIRPVNVDLIVFILQYGQKKHLIQGGLWKDHDTVAARVLRRLMV
jgi:hypothetical protein